MLAFLIKNLSIDCVRDRQTDRQKQRETDTDRQTQTDRQTDRDCNNPLFVRTDKRTNIGQLKQKALNRLSCRTKTAVDTGADVDPTVPTERI